MSRKMIVIIIATLAVMACGACGLVARMVEPTPEPTAVPTAVATVLPTMTAVPTAIPTAVPTATAEGLTATCRSEIAQWANDMVPIVSAWQQAIAMVEADPVGAMKTVVLVRSALIGTNPPMCEPKAVMAQDYLFGATTEFVASLDAAMNNNVEEAILHAEEMARLQTLATDTLNSIVR